VNTLDSVLRGGDCELKSQNLVALRLEQRLAYEFSTREIILTNSAL